MIALYQEVIMQKHQKGDDMKDIKIMGFDLKMFIIIAAVIVAACALGVLPEGMVGAFLFLMVFGALLNQIGNVTPIIKTFLGGGAIVCIFGMSKPTATA